MEKFLVILCVMFSSIIVHGLLSKSEDRRTLLEEAIESLLQQHHTEHSERAVNTADVRETSDEATGNTRDTLRHFVEAFVNAQKKRMYMDARWGNSVSQYVHGKGTDTTPSTTTTGPPPPQTSPVAATDAPTEAPTTAATEPYVPACKRWFWSPPSSSSWWCNLGIFKRKDNMDKLRLLQRMLAKNGT